MYFLLLMNANGMISLKSASISYTAGYKYDNPGLGLRLRFLPGVDLYAVTDNLIQAFNYKNAYRISASAGVNISIGVKPAPKMQNVPSVSSE